MSSGSPLTNWRFLIGKWNGAAENEFGEEGVVESTHVFSADLGEKLIVGRHEAWNAGKLVHKAASFLYYDQQVEKFRRKDIYSYGFVNNEVECARAENEIKFEVVSEPSPKQFERIQWRSYIRKISENKIAMGLEWSKGKGDFKSFGETIAVKELQPIVWLTFTRRFSRRVRRLEFQPAPSNEGLKSKLLLFL